MCDIPYGKTEELSTQAWKKIISDASGLGAQTIVFSGGEPFLRNDIFKLIESVCSKQLKLSINTNGMFIDKNADIDQRVQDWNYEATKMAIKNAVNREPKAAELLKIYKDSVHPFAAKK